MSTEEIPALMAGLQNSDPRRRESAAIELGKLKLARTAKSLVRHIADSDPRVRAAVRWALVQIGPASVDRIVATLDHQHNDGKAIAFATLGAIADPGGLSPLIEFLRRVNAGYEGYADSFRLQEATSAALDALSKILTASAARCTEDQLHDLAALPDATVMTIVGDDVQTQHAKKIGDCKAIRALAASELQRRGDTKAIPIET